MFACLTVADVGVSSAQHRVVRMVGLCFLLLRTIFLFLLSPEFGEKPERKSLSWRVCSDKKKVLTQGCLPARRDTHSRRRKTKTRKITVHPEASFGIFPLKGGRFYFFLLRPPEDYMRGQRSNNYATLNMGIPPPRPSSELSTCTAASRALEGIGTELCPPYFASI